MDYNIEFNEEKNVILKETRGVNFDEVLKAIEDKQILDILEHYNKNKFRLRLKVGQLFINIKVT